MNTNRNRRWLAILGPGILVAATGVGAGDLASAAFTGSALGVSVLWAVLLGAFLKFVLNEGLARWQLATGTTLIEGCAKHFGPIASWLFLGYLVVWSFLVAAALMSAVGVASHAIFPLLGADSPNANKVLYGVIHSLVAVALVRIGSFALFEKVMSTCIGIMFAVVVLTAVTLQPSFNEVLRGLVVPVVPPGGVAWTLALMGGIGGTVTVLCYGYWIREVGRSRPDDLPLCRVDLAVSYVAAAIFGIAMVVIGSQVGTMEGSGATLLADIARRLEASHGGAGILVKWAFLVGAWATVFSSLLGVWQSVPYLFADLWSMLHHRGERMGAIDTKSYPYRAYQIALATVPILGLVAVNFRVIQKSYAIVGALFIPMLAAVLLILNGRESWVGAGHRNSWWTRIVLIGALVFFIYLATQEIYEQF